jgi:hypothetical protein
MLEETNDIAELSDMLRRLRAADTSFRVFGSEQHRYSFGPTLSESELAAFESTNRIGLPNDYRRFLAMVGDGGAGPFYGLARLNACGRDLSRPFPFATMTDALARSWSGCRTIAMSIQASWRFATVHDDSEASWTAWRQEPRIIAARRRGGSALTGRHGWQSPTSKQQEPNSAGP